ncbi:MAG TPA: Calx-beta domain-containing protein, partial [Ignavibacteriaceae bacterium]|nr:Calx-beta domain-containing protein [Ignavibacteriaceae bacterium]
MIIRNIINSTLIAFVILMLFYSDAYTQTGPGGVGNSSSNILWLKADAITGLNDGDAVTTWSDNSGNGYNLTQANAAYKPTYETGEINGKPIIRFNSSSTDDYLIRNPFAGFATTQISAIVVNKNNGESIDGILSYASTASDNNFLLYNSASVNIYRNGNVNTSTPMNDNNFHIGGARWNTTGGATRYHKDGTQTYSGVLSAGASITSGGSLVLAQEQDAVGGGFDVAQTHTGDYAEVILYNTFINDAQIIIVQNYLAAKYLITMASNDYFAYETTHGNEVSGIGRTDASNIHTDAMSGGILEISSPGELGNNEYLLFGHDNASNSSWTTTEIPAGDVTDARRIAREWRFSETGDVGTVTVTLDATLLPAAPGGFTQYVFWLDSDGDFNTGATIYPLTSVGSNQYQATGINISDGDFITFGVVRPVILFTLASDNEFETTPAVNIEISLNYPLSVNSSVDYVVSGGTASGGGVDYTLANGTATILAYNTTTNISVSLVNDVLVESDETIVIDLLDGFGIPYNTHTFTIHDDDNPRKIDFVLASSNGDESVTPVTLGIQINIADAINPTTVDYSITGGTATGGGVDYTLASGTATILPTFTTTTISFMVNDDVIDEANETLIISLSNPTNSNIGTNITHTYTINDNDDPPTVQFNATSSSGSESVFTVNFQVDLSSISGQNVTVDYAVTGGTATGGGVDYTLASGTLTVLSGNSSGNINATIVNDVTEELNETIIITLSNPGNATLGANTVHTYTIIDNDPFGCIGPGGVGQSNNNVLWLKADEITGLSDGNNVTSWTDYSGNGNTLSQSNTTYTPRYYSNIINNKPVVRWEQADTRLRKTSFNNFPSTAVTSTFVNRNSDSNDGLISYATAADNNEYLIFNSGNVTQYRGGNNASGQVINGNTWRIVTATWCSSTGSWLLYRNGTQSYSGTVGSGTTI